MRADAARGDSDQQAEVKTFKMDTIKKLYEIYLESTGVTTDSRNVSPGSIFFALKGENFDGNRFVLQALQSGASFAVADDKSLPSDRRIIQTNNVLETLQCLAGHHRRVLGLPVFALTGSNGKTTTKELITAVLSTKFKVASTTGNLNNHIGVPLTILKMDKSTEMAVIEMGASGPGEIATLCSICQPDSGLITNVGKAHLLGFGSFEGVKKTKGELYDYLLKYGGTALYNGDNIHLSQMIAQREGINSIVYGLTSKDAVIMPATPENPFLRILLKRENITISTNLIGDYNADNVLAAIAVGEFAGVSLDKAVNAVENYSPSNNRSQLVKGRFNTLIVDAYNANPTSMRAALDNFSKTVSNKRAVVIGDMLELGEYSLNEHKAILKIIKEINPDKLFFVGKEFNLAAQGDEYYQRSDLFFKDSDMLREFLSENVQKGYTFLIKGSRGTKLEKVIDTL